MKVIYILWLFVVLTFSGCMGPDDFSNETISEYIYINESSFDITLKIYAAEYDFDLHEVVKGHNYSYVIPRKDSCVIQYGKKRGQASPLGFFGQPSPKDSTVMSNGQSEVVYYYANMDKIYSSSYYEYVMPSPKDGFMVFKYRISDEDFIAD